MSSSFATLGPRQEAEITGFLLRIFGMTAVPPDLSPPALGWKYFDPHPWWAEGRSYVLRTPGNEIAAHGCVAPVRFAPDGGGLVESMQVIDWAAGKAVPGAGLLVYRRCLEVSRGTLLAIGGSEDTRKIIPLVKWFSAREDIRQYGCPIRPWQHFMRSDKTSRQVAKLGRNLWWSRTPGRPSAGAWRARPARPGEPVFAHRGDFIPVVRTREWFDYLCRCPVAKTELVILEKDGVPAGHALLSNAEGSVRVADFVVDGEAAAQAERVPAFSAVLGYVAAQASAAELVAASSLTEVCGVFEQCGLRPRGVIPVYLADPRKQLSPHRRLETTLMIGDAFYRYDPQYPFAF